MSEQAKSIEFLKAFGGIDDRFIEEAMPKEFKAETGETGAAQGSGGGSVISLKRMFPIILAAALTAAIPLAAWGGSELFDTVREKTQEANLSAEEVSQLSNDLAEQGFTAEEMEGVEPLHENENGETYGVEPLGADLIAVVDDDGIEGYVYPKDLDAASNPLNEAYDHDTKVHFINVYASDGETVTGTFTVG